jgi:hypothetical protein
MYFVNIDEVYSITEKRIVAFVLLLDPIRNLPTYKR